MTSETMTDVMRVKLEISDVTSFDPITYITIYVLCILIVYVCFCLNKIFCSLYMSRYIADYSSNDNSHTQLKYIIHK
jgi:hypothetical protein